MESSESGADLTVGPGMPPPGDVLSLIGNTPMVRLGRVAEAVRAPVFGKCEFLEPGGSVKDRLALAIVDHEERAGNLKPGATLVEATAGNTGVGLALVAAQRGYRLACVLPAKMSADKRTALAALGAEVIVVPNAPPSSPDNFQHVARRMAAERGWFLTDQFRHPANPRVHETTTGPEILRQCGGRVGAFVAGVGTGGTITGVGEVLKDRNPDVKLVAVEPAGSAVLSGRRPGLHRIQGLGAGFVPEVLNREILDEVIAVSDDDAVQTARHASAREGVLCGISGGAALWAALQVARRPEHCGARIVAIVPDSGERYVSTPFFAP